MLPADMVTLTPAQKYGYLKHKGNFCPVCGDEEGIDSGKHNADDDWVSKDVVCHNCGATWKDIYALNDIVDVTPATVSGVKDPICAKCGHAQSNHYASGDCRHIMWLEIDFGHDENSATKSGKYHERISPHRIESMHKAIFETLLGPVEQIPWTRGWKVDHLVTTTMTKESWVVWIDDNRCIMVWGEK